MVINFHVSLITKRFFQSFDRHSDKTATHSELLLDINNFSNKIVDVIRKSHELSFKILRIITIVVSNAVNFRLNARLWRQSIASGYSMTSRFAAILLLSPPSYILYALIIATWLTRCRVKKGKVFYGQEPPSGEPTTTEWGVNFSNRNDLVNSIKSNGRGCRKD